MSTPEIDSAINDERLFGQLTAMLHVGALQQMGLLDNPLTKERKTNLTAAYESIAMLGMLARRMNLSDDEKEVAEKVLQDLIVRYEALMNLQGNNSEESETAL